MAGVAMPSIPIPITLSTFSLIIDVKKWQIGLQQNLFHSCHTYSMEKCEWKHSQPRLGGLAWIFEGILLLYTCYGQTFSRIVYPKDLNFIAKKLVLLKSEVEGNSHFCRARKEFGRILLKHTNIRMKDFLLIGGYFSFSQKYLLAR